jgi:hypothetical protein
MQTQFLFVELLELLETLKRIIGSLSIAIAMAQLELLTRPTPTWIIAAQSS